MTCTTTTRQVEVAPARHWFIKVFAAIWRTFKHRHEAQQMLQMTDHQLADIGLTRADVDAALAGPLLRDPTRELAQRFGRNS